MKLRDLSQNASETVKTVITMKYTSNELHEYFQDIVEQHRKANYAQETLQQTAIMVILLQIHSRVLLSLKVEWAAWQQSAAGNLRLSLPQLTCTTDGTYQDFGRHHECLLKKPLWIFKSRCKEICNTLLQVSLLGTQDKDIGAAAHTLPT